MRAEPRLQCIKEEILAVVVLSLTCWFQQHQFQATVKSGVVAAAAKLQLMSLDGLLPASRAVHLHKLSQTRGSLKSLKTNLRSPTQRHGSVSHLDRHNQQ